MLWFREEEEHRAYHFIVGMPRDNCERGFSRRLVAVNPAIDRDEIFLAESRAICAESARKLLCAALVISLSRCDSGEDRTGERATQRLDSFRQFQRRVDIAASPPHQSFVEDHQCVARIRLERTIIDRFPFSGSPRRRQLICHPEIGGDVLRVNGDRALRRLDHFAITASGKIDVAERRIGFRTFRVEGDRPMRGGLRRSPVRLPICACILRLDGKRDGEFPPRAREFGIESCRLLKQGNGTRQTVADAPADESLRLDEQRVSLRIVGRLIHETRFGRIGQDHVELAGNVARKRFLEVEDVGECSVVILRPDLQTVCGATQSRGDAHLFALLADRTFENVRNAKLGADLFQADVFSFVKK